MRTMQIPFVDLRVQHEALREELSAAFGRVLAHGQFILGREVAEFERAFAAYVGAAEAVGVSSGLDALRLALQALDIGPGDEVILPANTYIATALAVSAVGARPVLVDVEDVSFGLDPAQVERALSPRTRAIIPVHLYGQAGALQPILEMARAHRLKVVEDACQAHGVAYRGVRCGTLGDLGCFSFYPGKNLGALGDGGMVVARDPGLAERVRILRDYGQRAKYEHVEKGLNARLDAVQAAVLAVKLPHLDRWNELRARQAARYAALLADVPGLSLPGRNVDSTHIFHLFVIRVPCREALREYLAARGIQTGIHYPVPIHLQKAYADLGQGPGAFPVTERLAGEILSLPMYPELADEQVEYVVRHVRNFLEAGYTAWPAAPAGGTGGAAGPGARPFAEADRRG